MYGWHLRHRRPYPERSGDDHNRHNAHQQSPNLVSNEKSAANDDASRSIPPTRRLSSDAGGMGLFWPSCEFGRPPAHTRSEKFSSGDK